LDHTMFTFSSNLGMLRSTGAIGIHAVFIKLAQLALAFSGNLEELSGQFNGLFFGVHLKNCESADYLFRFRERTVSHSQVAIGASHPRPECRRQAALRGQQPTLPRTFFDQIAHGGHFLLCWRGSTLNRLIDTKESHRSLLC